MLKAQHTMKTRAQRTVKVHMSLDTVVASKMYKVCNYKTMINIKIFFVVDKQENDRL